MKSVSTNDPEITLKARIAEKKRNIMIIEAGLYNSAGEICTKAICTYFTFPPEKVREEMKFLACEVEE